MVPQMSPLMWVILMFFFLIFFFLLSISVYFKFCVNFEQQLNSTSRVIYFWFFF